MCIRDSLCVGFFESGATVNFLISDLVNGESSGNFEFCGVDDQDDCVSELVISPDGTVVLNNISTTQPLAFFKEGGETSTKYSTVVASDYFEALHQYEEQGTIGYDRSDSDIANIETSTIKALRYENSKMTGDDRILNR